MRFALLALPLALAAGSAAQASSDQAWARLNLAVAQKCAASSGLRHAHISEIVMFDDSVGKVAALVTGVSPERNARGFEKKLCLFDKRTGRATIGQADGWNAPDLR